MKTKQKKKKTRIFFHKLKQHLANWEKSKNVFIHHCQINMFFSPFFLLKFIAENNGVSTRRSKRGKTIESGFNDVDTYFLRKSALCHKGMQKAFS